MNRKCIGCGATLQCTDENKVGYVPKDKLDSAKYCMSFNKKTFLDFADSAISFVTRNKRNIIYELTGGKAPDSRDDRLLSQ